MLLTLAIANFRSFGDASVLDMKRRSFRTQHPRQGETWRSSTWRRAAIFGPNAAGKSNILLALDRVKSAVDGSLTCDSFVKKLRDPHKLNARVPTVFEVEYVSEGIRYRWGLEVDNRGVSWECLDANANSRWYAVYERSRDNIVFGPSSDISQAAKRNIEQFMTPWALALSAWGTLRDQGRHGSAVSWWSRVLAFVDTSNSEPQEGRHQKLMDLVERDPHLGNKHRAGIGDQFALSEVDESRGPQAWTDLAGPALVALGIGGVLVVDEADRSLHPVLVRELVSYFDDAKLNPLGAQLLFSTHDLTLLGKYPDEGLGRAEVWLVDKQDSFSELIALDEFPLKAHHNIERRYLEGRYGAVPLLDQAGLLARIGAIREAHQNTLPHGNALRR